MQRVEKARQAILYSKILLRSTKQEIGSITASFGIAHASEKESEASLQSRAEEATLLSKLQGRNRITQL
jgi:GGDEF domain-containing protein